MCFGLGIGGVSGSWFVQERYDVSWTQRCGYCRRLQIASDLCAY